MKKLILITIFLIISTHLVFADITTGLQAWWKFDEASSGTCTGTTPDSSGNSYALSCVNSPVYVVGKIGPGALSFNQVNQEADAGSQIIGTVGSQPVPFTLSAWVNMPSPASAAQAIVTWGLGGPYLRVDDKIQYIKSQIALGLQGATSITANTWQMVSVTVDGSNNVVIYLNGVSDGSTNFSTSYTSSAAPVIGVEFGGNEHFGGNLDDIRIYNRALTSGDMTELYAYTGKTIRNISIPNAKIRNAKFNI